MIARLAIAGATFALSGDVAASIKRTVAGPPCQSASCTDTELARDRAGINATRAALAIAAYFVAKRLGV